MKPLKEPKQWNTWQWTFLSVAHSYDFMDITDLSYSPDSLDHDEVKVFELKQKHTFTILVANVKEPSVLPIVHKYADSNATHDGNAQLLYYNIVAHYTQGLTGRQCLEIIERELDDLRLDTKWGKTCESILTLVDNKLKDHQGIAPGPIQFQGSWYITRLNRTIEPHTTLYQFIVNHQMQADAIARHTGTPSAAATTYESHLEHVRTFCQTIDHIKEKTRRKALQAEFERGNGRGWNGRGEGRGHGRGHGDGRGVTPGRGRRSEGRGGPTSGRCHNWIPHEQFDQLDNESHARLIWDRVARGELAANNTESTTATVTPTSVGPVNQVQVPSLANTETPHSSRVLHPHPQLL